MGITAGHVDRIGDAEHGLSLGKTASAELPLIVVSVTDDLAVRGDHTPMSSTMSDISDGEGFRRLGCSQCAISSTSERLIGETEA